MFSAKYDKIVNYEENVKWSSKIKGVKLHEILDGDHLSFLCGKDMAFMD
jgi:surfactin synthase thioesterase subunit